MPKRYFLDACVLYAAVNEKDNYHYRVKSFLEKIVKENSEMFVTQYVLLEYILLSKIRASREYFEKNPDLFILPKEENDKIIEKIKETLITLDGIGIKLLKVFLPEKLKNDLKEIAYRYTPKRKRLEKVKHIGLVDLIHLVSCSILNCDTFVTFDKDFKDQAILNSFEESFRIWVL